MTGLRRATAIGAMAAGLVLVTTVPAFAQANPKASCVGFVASSFATAGQLDVAELKDLAAALGAPNFGRFVAEGAKLHLGDLDACVPEAP